MQDAIPKLLNSAVLSLLLINAARSYAGKLHLIDRPGGRKRHHGAVPTVGGVCIFCAFLLQLSLDPHLLAFNAVLILNMGLLVCVGAFDDAVDLSAPKKLAFEIIAAGMLVTVTGERISDIGGIVDLGPVIGASLAVVMVLCIINAVNMADGVDGLAGWLTCVALAWLAVAASLNGFRTMDDLAIRLSMPVLAFLAFNSRSPWRHRAAVFMGDGGTLMLGYAISWFCLELARHGIPVIASSLVVAVPVSDTISLFFRRLLSGRSPFSADRRHMHHLLEEAGLPPGTISLLLGTASAMIGGFGILGAYAGLPRDVFLAAWALVLICHGIAVRLISRRVCRSSFGVAAGAAE
jgi:UDP-GlcNAc:undecaprenyl-phosphate GlcNAc-1-phosphate transferase